MAHSTSASADAYNSAGDSGDDFMTTVASNGRWSTDMTGRLATGGDGVHSGPRVSVDSIAGEAVNTKDVMQARPTPEQVAAAEEMKRRVVVRDEEPPAPARPCKPGELCAGGTGEAKHVHFAPLPDATNTADTAKAAFVAAQLAAVPGAAAFAAHPHVKALLEQQWSRQPLSSAGAHTDVAQLTQLVNALAAQRATQQAQAQAQAQAQGQGAKPHPLSPGSAMRVASTDKRGGGGASAWLWVLIVAVVGLVALGVWWWMHAKGAKHGASVRASALTAGGAPVPVVPAALGGGAGRFSAFYQGPRLS